MTAFFHQDMGRICWSEVGDYGLWITFVPTLRVGAKKSIIHNLNSQSRHRYFSALSEISLRHQAPSQRMHFTAL